jgi:N-acetylmuramoyl-L-alanine amidase
MRARQVGRIRLVQRVRRFLLFVIVAGMLLAGVMSWISARAGDGPAWLVKLAGPVQDLAGKHIGIVAGHSGYDTGTVCPDGLTEASINMAIARDVVTGLRRRGAQVDLLQEFDSRLRDYRADAFLSIHADSCQVDFSGYKVANLEGGTIASQEFTDCLWQGYGTATGLPRHPNTITYDMTGYHAFREIAADTPASIIETGFLKADRELLTTNHERAVQGVLAGIGCFLAPAPHPTSTP